MIILDLLLKAGLCSIIKPLQVAPAKRAANGEIVRAVMQAKALTGPANPAFRPLFCTVSPMLPLSATAPTRKRNGNDLHQIPDIIKANTIWLGHRMIPALCGLPYRLHRSRMRLCIRIAAPSGACRMANITTKRRRLQKEGLSFSGTTKAIEYEPVCCR